MAGRNDVSTISQKVFRRFVRGLQKLIAHRLVKILLPPEPMPLIILSAKRCEALPAWLEGPRLFDDRRGFEECLNEVHRGRHHVRDKVFAGRDALIDWAVDPELLQGKPARHRQSA